MALERKLSVLVKQYFLMIIKLLRYQSIMIIINTKGACCLKTDKLKQINQIKIQMIILKTNLVGVMKQQQQKKKHNTNS